ncbi:MAG TPA: acylneuraminate cytidylyltransferase, partial [Bacteroidales bacterium]|nr:acylneuraminate cytidylyltransferase [Bacteroidales bacterium]
MKGHSERVPGKNMKPFNGVPLYHTVMKELLKSKYICRVFVNTDSVMISDDVKKYFP